MITNLILLGLLIVVLSLSLTNYQKWIKLRDALKKKVKDLTDDNDTKQKFINELKIENNLQFSQIEIKTKKLLDKEKEIGRGLEVVDKMYDFSTLLKDNNDRLRIKLKDKMMDLRITQEMFTQFFKTYESVNAENEKLRKTVKTNKPLGRIVKLEQSLVNIQEVVNEGFWEDKTIDKDCNKITNIINKTLYPKKKK
mgnify:CR=1 FL=1